MKNDTLNPFVSHICRFLPDRMAGKRGTRPIPKEILVTELFRLFKTNCGWRNIKYSSTCRNYLNEMQRRGNFKKYFNNLIAEDTKFRLSKSIVDSSDIVSYDTGGKFRFSGKYHNPCVKFTLEVNENCLPVYGRLDNGSEPDSLILDKILIEKDKLSYELYADKGYEKYERRRFLQKRNCQVRIEMKNVTKNRKRGPRFTFTKEHKHMRGLIEKVNAWIKVFMIIRLNTTRTKSITQAIFTFCLSSITFNRLLKL